jgi:hypothetical protein
MTRITPKKRITGIVHQKLKFWKGKNQNNKVEIIEKI